jgi:hypothetical protein
MLLCLALWCQGLGNLFPTVMVHKHPRDFSDHNPLILSTTQKPSVRTRDFRFEITWIKQPKFLSKVQGIWETPTRDHIPLDRFLFKLKKVKKFLKGWGFNLAGSKKKRKQEIQ